MGDTGESCCADTCVANTTASCGCGTVCESGDDCIFAGGLPGLPLGMGICCGMEIPIIGGFCTDFGDAGLPGLDAGIPIP